MSVNNNGAFFLSPTGFQALGSGNLKGYSQKNLNASDIVSQATVIATLTVNFNLLLESKGEVEACSVKELYNSIFYCRNLW